jgi:L1 cell adhesion molecule like protein
MVKEGIEWLESNQNAEKEEYDEQQKKYEDKIRPIMMKLYQNAGATGAAEGMPDMSGMGSAGAESSGPRVEEVD